MEETLKNTPDHSQTDLRRRESAPTVPFLSRIYPTLACTRVSLAHSTYLRSKQAPLGLGQPTGQRGGAQARTFGQRRPVR